MAPRLPKAYKGLRLFRGYRLKERHADRKRGTMLRGLVEYPKAGRSVTLIGLTVVVLVVCLVIPTAPPTFAGTRVRGPNEVAESNLIRGIAAAVTYYTQGDTFTGFDAAEGTAIERSLTWANGDAVAQNVVSVGRVSATGTRVMLETLSRSGTSFCIAFDLGRHADHVYGRDTAGRAFKDYHGCKNASSGSWWRPTYLGDWPIGGLWCLCAYDLHRWTRVRTPSARFGR